MVASCFSVISLYGGYLRHCLSAAGLSSQSLDIDDQTTLHFWGPKPQSSSASNPKSKPPLLLIHGFGPHGPWQWRQQIVFFCRQFDLYVPDLVFFGGSATKSAERSEVFQADCLVKLMERVGVKERFHVVGTSYGGFVAYHLAAMWPERVGKVVIASSGINLRRKDNEELMRRAKVEKIEELMLPGTAGQLRTLMRLSVFRRPYMPDFLLNDFVYKLYSENRMEKLELLKGLTLGKDDTVNICPLRQDVLIVWGEHDQIFLLEKAVELKELLGNKARLEVIKDTSHVPQLEQAAKFNNIVSKFLCGSS